MDEVLSDEITVKVFPQADCLTHVYPEPDSDPLAVTVAYPIPEYQNTQYVKVGVETAKFFMPQFILDPKYACTLSSERILSSTAVSLTVDTQIEVANYVKIHSDRYCHGYTNTKDGLATIEECYNYLKAFN